MGKQYYIVEDPNHTIGKDDSGEATLEIVQINSSKYQIRTVGGNSAALFPNSDAQNSFTSKTDAENYLRKTWKVLREE